MNSGIPGKAAMSYILSDVFQIVAYQNYAMDSRLRGNDSETAHEGGNDSETAHEGGNDSETAHEGKNDSEAAHEVRNDSETAHVIPAKAGIYCKTIQYLYFALYMT
jgi:hypothetical protein